MKTSETTKMIFKAMCQFRKQLKQPLKDADNPFFKSKYVPLENIVSVIDDAINGTGLSYTQEVIYTENGSIMTQTIITHESGEYIIIDGSMMKPTKQDPQGIGSTITYGRRYSLSLAFGIASDIDDDGNAGSSGKPVNQTEKPNQKKQNVDPEAKLKTKVEKMIKVCMEKYGASDGEVMAWRDLPPQSAYNDMVSWVEVKKTIAEDTVDELLPIPGAGGGNG